MTVALGRTGHSAPPATIDAAWSAWNADRCSHARDALVAHYMKSHVQPLVMRFRARLPQHIEVDDLLQQAAFGLMECLDRFEPGRDIKFETFSAQRIVGSLVDYLRRVDTVSRQARQAERLLRQTADRFEKSNGRAPTEAEIQCELKLSDKAFTRFQRHATVPATLPLPSRRTNDSEAATIPFADRTEEVEATNPDRPLERDDLRRWLLAGLTREDKLIITLYYFENLTLREIGLTLGISESRVSQKKDEILKSMRDRMQRDQRVVELECA